MSHGAGATTFERRPEYSDRLYNEDLAPLRPQTWNWYNIFAFWMSDVHSVGGYVFAGSLFALGIGSWQVLISLVVGITIVNVLCNWVARPSQQAGVPYPVACRLPFGVFGANIPAVIRGLIAVAWYGIQTYLASAAFVVLLLRFFPGLQPLAESSFAGLSILGWIGFMSMWVLQAIVFWFGMEAIKKFIDFAGPAVYVVMFLLAIYITVRAGGHVSLNLAEVKYTGSAAILPMITATALVVSYFSGPMLNFGDFSRYGKNFDEVKKGNFWGLPVNVLLFSLVAVITTSGTFPVFGKLITDPIEIVAHIDNTFAVVLGAFTFVTATIGINIVANFVSPAFDFSNVAPKYISWRTGGFIAAVGSIFITPWNLFNNPQVIHFTLDALASFIGPLFGILLVDFYLVKRRKIDVDSLYIADERSRYWYTDGWHLPAVYALIPAVLVGLLITFTPGLKGLANFAWFTGAGLGAVFYYLLSARERLMYARGEPAAALGVLPSGDD
ncbi:NCS1 family nucleobase:cation symporter-1 (plasmid) [Deinococcus metallilatus]|uniref:NCS1 family nucleobase:cation symporter-1 n=1 Tax=Deinococcus metallilatus TaxID=1211322 RepID=A0AAJ5FAJ1_9DEIO|nr:NCS1 family nucleobase:cation symporter-1 [Deinococcus metallilatus]MBB5297377.1 NCS1 family nucleobase:cation symporter-1 [Deinococcus metallilatus]QBY06942.1 NCS1 family nucleobase:cation symporter-1 [Deinococcus metallilatus]TLK32332.1 NCS1 family nucleobase:cation symporter-1 [Deinococcus metallilatus]GMA17082.1 transport-related membrane protein [Deinococcus metallilatus]